ncbi:MAG: DUF4837 family protein [Bacteroidales bacterium]|nr:DUF4837 family protein [Candidatus Colimorpha pelethequi]
MKRILVVFTCLLMLAACGPQTTTSTKKGSSGKTLEVLLVADKETYSGETKELIDSLFQRPQDGMPQMEPIFDLVNIPVSSFRNTEMFQAHRNVIICDINPKNPNKVFFHTDQYAAPQVIFDFAVTDRAKLEELLQKYEKRILEDIYKTEHRRMYKVFKSIEDVEIRETIKKQFGFSMIFSNEFEIAKPNNPSPDFMWIRKEAKDFGIGVLIQVSPYTDQKQFEEAVILDNLDTMMRHHVPTSAPGSYMGTERRLDFHSQPVTFEDASYCLETRGCWRSFGDFMGGPFVTYTLSSPDNTQLITLTGYVYYPSGRLKNLSKRDLLMQVEGICHTFKY